MVDAFTRVDEAVNREAAASHDRSGDGRWSIVAEIQGQKANSPIIVRAVV